MGQAASSQRHDSQQRQQRHDTNPGIQVSRPPSTRTGMAGGESQPVELPASGSYSISPAPSLSPMSRSTDMLDTLPEMAEPSLSMGMESRNDASSTLASPGSARRRQSTASRLGSRILPNSVVRGLLNSGEETPAEGRALRSGLFSRSSPRPDGSHRFPSFSGLSSRGITRRRSVRGPYPLPREAALLPDSPQRPASPAGLVGTSRFAWRPRARLSHVRNSITSPISQIFGQPPPLTMDDENAAPSSNRQSRASYAEDADHLLPLVSANDTHIDFNEAHELDSVEPAARGSLSQNPSNTGRSHSARLRRREEQTPLSRILHLAAAAIAAQLTGTPAPTDPGIQSLGSEGLGGPLETLLQTLHGVTSGQTDDTGTPDGAANDAANAGGLPNVNFLRVFRFVNSDPASGGGSSSQQETNAADQMEVDGQDSPNGNGDNERRLLTLVVVGVRSMPATNGSGNADNGSGGRLNVESLLPLLSPTNFLRNERRPGGLPRRPDRRSRSSAQRHSLGSSPVSSNFFNHQRSQASSRRQSDAGLSGDLAGSLPTTFTESPPGPNPPPSTPAESNLSRVASGANTPSRRPSSASAFLPQLNEDPAASPNLASPESFPRQRRRSDSEAARHRGLGSGAARRNGVVEPDNPDNPSQATTRSWLIYVIGTNLAENHPAFATPSLFTDNPTYEDMILLSSLLGPAKPPVASQEDVASAGGVYRLTEYYGSLVAESLDEGEPIPVPEQERCLICLADYEAGEEIRKLTKCKHLYHRECIDEWLLTGRNSCPLCRGEGVSESANPGEEEATAS